VTGFIGRVLFFFQPGQPGFHVIARGGKHHRRRQGSHRDDRNRPAFRGVKVPFLTRLGQAGT
jgi:hypothetical protein